MARSYLHHYSCTFNPFSRKQGSFSHTGFLLRCPASENMQRSAEHLINVRAFTRQSLPMSVLEGKRWVSAVDAILEKWESERTGYLKIWSPITFETPFDRSYQPNGLFCLIVEQRAAVNSFVHYPSSLCVLQIRDNKGVFVGYWFKIPPHLLATLTTSS